MPAVVVAYHARTLDRAYSWVIPDGWEPVNPYAGLNTRWDRVAVILDVGRPPEDLASLAARSELFGPGEPPEGELYELELSDLVWVECGSCRVIGTVEFGAALIQTGG
jgi:hypothetical protein